MKVLHYYLIVFLLFTFASCDRSKINNTDTEVTNIVARDYVVDEDFHFKLSELVQEPQSDHRGVKSLLEKAGISFYHKNSLVALNTADLLLHFENTEEEQEKLKKLLESIY